MGSYNINDYTRLSANGDLKPTTVEQKLEKLVGSVPDKFRPQIDRCLSMGFNDVLLMVGHSDLGGLNKIPYFTEDPQTQEFHKLAFQIFCPVVTYGGYLGQLIRTSDASHVHEAMLESAERVFKYAEKEKDLPDMNRADLVEFRRALQRMGNIQGDISLN